MEYARKAFIILAHNSDGTREFGRHEPRHREQIKHILPWIFGKIIIEEMKETYHILITKY
jgi:hypothetical protein